MNRPRIRSALALALSTLTVAACTTSAPPRKEAARSAPAVSAEVAPKPTPSARIEWNDWGPEAFAAAKAGGKLIVVDVGMEGCTACRWMDEDTYRNAEVIRRMSEHFVAIQVDAEARPDIGERYTDWAWPATIFMAPDGTQVLALRGNKRPRNFMRTVEGSLPAPTLQVRAAAGSRPRATPRPGCFSTVWG